MTRKRHAENPVAAGRTGFLGTRLVGGPAIEPSAQLLERLAAGDRLALARVTRMVTGCLRRLGAYDLGDEWQDLCQEWCGRSCER